MTANELSVMAYPLLNNRAASAFAAAFSTADNVANQGGFLRKLLAVRSQWRYPPPPRIRSAKFKHLAPHFAD